MSQKKSMKTTQIHQIFQRAADQFPENIALECHDTQLSYCELDQRANQLAQYLIQQGLKNNNVIGILLERSIESYVSMLAIVKIGATFVPIDVDYPEERVNYIFSDLPFHAVITSSNQLERAQLQFPKTIILDKLTVQLTSLPNERPTLASTANDSNNTCYIIYTSGSTGKPKGVEVTHRSICHYAHTASELYGMLPTDRVYQGFSLAFDASLEEIWMAFANGAALIACTSKDIRTGVGLVDFLNNTKISFFSTVPTLLASLEGELPHLRILVLGGEASTANLINRWYRPGLKIFNTYGPTEATVIATYTECHPDQTITIGRPLPGHEVLILDENLQPVAAGAEGELCIGGIGLAKGYINSPEITAQKFFTNPNNKKQRLYRTGDLACTTLSGDIQYLGRVDDQVKLRGYRIELNEIETVMMQYDLLHQAVVALQQLESPTLVAYLLVNNPDKFDLDGFKRFLNQKLPHYMIPVFYELVEAFPLLPSGKVDRKKLPKPKQTIQLKDYVAPYTEMEKKIATVWEEALQYPKVSVTADFFYDLGGHSLTVAKVVSKLRTLPGLQTLSILDIYQNPTIREIATKFTHANVKKARIKPAKTTTPSWIYALCSIGQFFGCLFLYAISAWQLLAIIICYCWVAEHREFLSWESIAIFISLFFIMPIASLSIPITLKWLLLGRVKPGQHRLWGWFYFRWWLVGRLVQNVFSPKYFVGSPLINIYYRLLGAKIGKNCFIGSMHLSTPDMITIGDNSSIGYDTSMTGYLVEDGWLKIGRIAIGKDCFVGARSHLNINTAIKDGAALDHMSMLPEHNTIPAGQFYAGSPAVLSITPEEHLKQVLKNNNDATQTKHSLSFSLLHYLSLVLAMIVHYSCYIPSFMLLSYFYEHSQYATTMFLAIPIGAIIYLLLYYVSTYLCKKLLFGDTKSGIYPLNSFHYLRYWTLSKLLDTNEVLVMADSLYLPKFIRLLGAALGSRVEMGEVPHVIPDLITIEEEGFLASSVALAWPEVHLGNVKFAPVKIGRRAFAGNVSFVPAGYNLGPGSLLGSMTITPPSKSAEKSDTAWLGSPAVFLPTREVFTGFSEQETYNPPKRLIFQRVAIEFLRIIMPTTCSLMLFFNLLYVIDYLIGNYTLLTTIIVLPFAELGITLALVGAVIALKWLLVGKMKPSITPIWNKYIWKNDIREYSYSYFINQYLTDFIIGTPFISMLYRCMGSKIGKRLFCDTNLFAEFDLITIGNDVCINAETRIQTHLYEDRIFKISTVVIKDGCNVGNSSAILYDTIMEDNSTLGSLSLLMKGEVLPANTHWEGIPAQSVPDVIYDKFTQTATLDLGKMIDPAESEIELDAIER